MRRLTPQQKKQYSYELDCRNCYGENSKSSRKAITKRKSSASRANRRIGRQYLGHIPSTADSFDAEILECKLLGKPQKKWRKYPDTPLKEYVKSRIARRMRLKMVNINYAGR